MNEMSVTNIAHNPIQLNQEEAAQPILTRRQKSELYNKEFFEKLAEANPQESDRRENRQTENESAVKEDLTTESTRQDPEDDITSEPVNDDFIDEGNELDNKPIPKKRFDKELEKRKVLESELQRERELRIRSETEMSLYTKAIDQMNNQQQQPERRAEIDPIDTDAHNLYMNRINELEKKYETQNTNLSDYQTRQDFAQTIDRQAAEYTRTNPDFGDAYNYLLSIKAGEAKMFGADEQRANQYALEQIKPIAWEAYKTGKNVAEIAYNMAKNYGYKAHNTTIKTPQPNMDNINKNMPKSYSAIDEVPGVSTSVAKETAAFNNIEGFNRKLSNANGRGINQSEFYKAVEKLRNG